MEDSPTVRKCVVCRRPVARHPGRPGVGNCNLVPVADDRETVPEDPQRHKTSEDEYEGDTSNEGEGVHEVGDEEDPHCEEEEEDVQVRPGVGTGAPPGAGTLPRPGAGTGALPGAVEGAPCSVWRAVATHTGGGTTVRTGEHIIETGETRTGYESLGHITRFQTTSYMMAWRVYLIRH